MRVITRAERGALGPRGPARVARPVDTIFVHHSVSSSRRSAFADARTVDQIGIERFGRTSYSYMNHPSSGDVLEGQGDWIGAHTGGRNSTSLGFCFIGNYEKDRLSDLSIRSFIEWRLWAVATGRVRVVHTIKPHRSVKATSCPGNDIIRRWGALTGLIPTVGPVITSPIIPQEPDMRPEVQVDPNNKRRTLVFPTGVAWQDPTPEEESAFRAVLDLGRDDDVSLSIEVDRYQALYNKAHRAALGLA